MMHHSDAGSEYTAITFRNTLIQFEALASIGTVGDSYNNAMAESVNGLYKTECYRRRTSWTTVGELELATSEWVAWYNTHRLHSSLGHVPPIEFENAHCQSLLATV